MMRTTWPPHLVAITWLVAISAMTATTMPAPGALPDFVEIPAGPFVMGTDSSRDPQPLSNELWSADEDRQTVELPNYFIARHEVTVSQFAQFVRATRWSIDQRALAANPSQPVTYVSWPDALAYCRWLESVLKMGASAPSHVQKLLRDGWRVTLPTEAEWEKAARSHVYPASGIVWQWTRSPYQPYVSDSFNNRVNLDADALWVMRGGRFGEDARLARTTTRGGADPGARRPFIGFRVVISRDGAKRTR